MQHAFFVPKHQSQSAFCEKSRIESMVLTCLAGLCSWMSEMKIPGPTSTCLPSIIIMPRPCAPCGLHAGQEETQGQHSNGHKYKFSCTFKRQGWSISKGQGSGILCVFGYTSSKRIFFFNYSMHSCNINCKNILYFVMCQIGTNNNIG